MPRAEGRRVRARLRAALVGGLVVGLMAALPGRNAAAEPGCLRGVNLSGAEFGTVPGRYTFDYFYPKPGTIERFAALGITSLRFPVKWERLQPVLGQPLDPEEMLRLDAAFVAAKQAGLRMVISIHNSAYYGTVRIGTGAVTAEAFADLWRRLAGHFRSEPGVVFGLMNEPFDIPVAEWLPVANAGIAAIRGTGARQLVLVPGTAWSSVVYWETDTPVGNNARTMLGVVDPADNVGYDVHQYLDADFSGRVAACPRGGDALRAVERMTAWLAQHRRRAHLGEIGASSEPGCAAHLAAILAHLNAHPDQWLGWAIWGAGAMWRPDYPLRIDTEGANPAVVAAIREAARAAPRCGARP